MNTSMIGFGILGALLLAVPAPATAQAHISPSQATRTQSRAKVQTIRRPSVWYVNAAHAGPSNGRNWVHPFSDLQEALAVAGPGDSIWVSAGSYYTTAPGGGQDATLRIPSGVAVYGGFAGGETLLSQRDPHVNVSILSGDINRDDVLFPSYMITTSNSWNVVTIENADASTRLDGFEVWSGHLQFAPLFRRVGAGIRMSNSSATIARCKFFLCIAEKGGAIDNVNGDAVIEDCQFSDNSAIAYSGRGGAVRNLDGLLTVTNCSFTQNFAEALGGYSLGGALHNENGTTLVEGCDFRNNRSLPRIGGGVSVSQGGAISCFSGFLRATNCSFTNNRSNIGGAVSCDGWNVTTDLINCQFFGNNTIPAVLAGGIDGGDLAGGIYGGINAVTNIIGCLVTGCTSDNHGGGIVRGTGLVSGSIFWGNTDGRGQIGASQIDADRVYNSCVMNMLIGEPGEDPPEASKFPGSIDLNPLFVNASGGDYHLQQASPCIDAGDNTAWPLFITTDYEGADRFFDDPIVPDTGIGTSPIVDMGPYEHH